MAKDIKFCHCRKGKLHLIISRVGKMKNINSIALKFAYGSHLACRINLQKKLLGYAVPGEEGDIMEDTSGRQDSVLKSSSGEC